MADGTVAVKQASSPDRLIDNEVFTVGLNQIYRQKVAIGNTTGTWAYYAGAAGTVGVTAGQRVLGIAAHSTSGGTMTINGGSAVIIPANGDVAFEPLGNLTAPSIVFTGTDSYFVEVVS